MQINTTNKLIFIKDDFRNSLFNFSKYKIDKIEFLKMITSKVSSFYLLQEFNQTLQENTMIENLAETQLVVNVIAPKIYVIFNDQTLIETFQQIDQKTINQRIPIRPLPLQITDNLTAVQNSIDNKNNLIKQKFNIEDFFDNKQQNFSEIFRHIYFNNEFKIKTYKESLIWGSIVAYSLNIFGKTTFSQKLKTIENLKIFEKFKQNGNFGFIKLFAIIDLFKIFITKNLDSSDNIFFLTLFSDTLCDNSNKQYFKTVILSSLIHFPEDTRFFPIVILKIIQSELENIRTNFSEKLKLETLEYLFYLIFFFTGNHYIARVYDVTSHSLHKSTLYDPTFNQKMSTFFDLLNKISLSNYTSLMDLNNLCDHVGYLLNTYTHSPAILKFPFNVNFCESLIIHHVKHQFINTETSFLTNIDQLKHIYSVLQEILDLEETSFFGIVFRYIYLQNFKVCLMLSKPVDSKSNKLANFLCKFYSCLKNQSPVINYAILKSVDDDIDLSLNRYIPQQQNSHFGFLLKLFMIVHFFRKNLKKNISLIEEIFIFVEKSGYNAFQCHIKSNFIKSEDLEKQITEYITQTNSILPKMISVFKQFQNIQLKEVAEILDISSNDKTQKIDPHSISSRFIAGFLLEFKRILKNYEMYSEDIVKSMPLLICLISNIESEINLDCVFLLEILRKP